MKPNWKPGHPTEDGVYWISVAPKHREPTHWEQPKSPSVWLVWVNDGFCQALTQGMKSYPLSAVPPCDAIMKHAEAEFDADREECSHSINDLLFDCAKWSRRETPADPFQENKP